MNDNSKFKLVQDKESKLLRLEFWTKYGENKDDWVNIDSIQDMTISDLRLLRDYINSICKQNHIAT